MRDLTRNRAAAVSARSRMVGAEGGEGEGGGEEGTEALYF